MTEIKIPHLRGRPKSGTAKTANERSEARDGVLKAAGGRILSRVRLSPEAAAALAALSLRHGGDREAIQLALIAAEKINNI